MSMETIPLDFVIRHAHLTWCTVLYGFEKRWIAWKDVATIADTFLIEGSSDERVIELSTLSKDTAGTAGELLRSICGELHESRTLEAQRTWLLVGLLWLSANETRVSDPLSFAEDLVDDIEHPEETLRWLRVMPASGKYDPTQHSYSQNYNRLMSTWRQYLLDNAGSYLKDYASVLRASRS